MTEVVAKTEDGCEMRYRPEEQVRFAPRWAKHRVSKAESKDLDIGDFVQTHLGWSSIIDVSHR